MWNWLTALPALAAVLKALAEMFGKKIDASERRAEWETAHHAGADAAGLETATDTAEIADAQNRINSERSNPLSIARELRAQAAATANRCGNNSGKGA